MQKKAISIFFITLFTLFIVAPTVITVIEDTFDISVFYSVNEEENKENESGKTFEVKFTNARGELNTSLSYGNENIIFYYFNSYSQLNQENISPPPEYI